MKRYTLLILLIFPFTVLAADAPRWQPVPEIPPPPGMMNGPALEPEITLVQRGEDKVAEYRVRGKLYLVKVTPPHGTPYFLVDTHGNGEFRRFEEVTPQLLVPMWVLMHF
jgi:hypothetical protein